MTSSNSNPTSQSSSHSTNQAQQGSFTLLLFASASTHAGNIETLTLPAPTTLRQIFTTLETKFPGITRKVLRSSAVTVNLEYVDFGVDDMGNDGVGIGEEDGGAGSKDAEGLDMPIRPGDEVGIIPPVSSG